MNPQTEKNCYPFDLGLAALQLQHLNYSDEDYLFLRFINKDTEEAQKLKFKFRDIDKHLKTIEAWQLKGCDAYFVVNGLGDTDKNISECRAVFYEHDDLSLDEQISLWKTLNLPEPTFQLSTGGKSIHSYWAFSQPIPVQDWRVLQTDLLEQSGGDRSIKNPSRVMRLAGAWHIKGDRQSTIINHSGIQYSYEQLREAVPIAQSLPQIRLESNKPLAFDGTIPLTAVITKEHRALIDQGAAEGGRDNLGAALIRDLLGSAEYLRANNIRFDGDPYSLLQDYCNRCNPPLDSKACDRLFKSGEKSNPSPCLSNDAIVNCVRAWERKQQPQGKVVQLRPSKKIDDEYDSDQPSTEYEEPRKGKIAPMYRIYEALKAEYLSKLSWNELTLEIELLKKPIDLKDLRNNIVVQNKGIISLSPIEEYEQAMIYMAKQNSYHPIRDYLNSCLGKYSGLTRDACYQVFDETLTCCLGVELNPMYQIYIRRFLISAVARIVNAGSQADNVLVLQGKTGSRKTSFCKSLCSSDSWFSSSLPDNVAKKEAYLLIRNRWIVEMAELERFTSSKAGDGILKNFITTTHDDFLPPYGRQIMSFPRNCVFIGTVNRVDFLKDPTGSRRFWIIPNVDNVDVEWIDSNRDLLWAAAYQMYKFEPKLPDEDDEALKNVTRLNSVFESESAWESTIAANLTQYHKTQITTKEILVDVLKFEISRITRQAEMQVADVMHKLGWQKKVVKLSDRSSLRCWVNPESY